MVAKHGGYTGSVPECHDVPMAPLDSFIQLGTNEAGEPVLLEYAFALCIPSSWPFSSSMNKTILPETYFTEGNPGEEGANTVTVARKTCKHKGKKTQNRSKVLEPPAVPRRPAQLRPRLLPKLIKNVPSKSSRIYIFLLTGLTLRSRTTPVTLPRVPT